MEIHPHNHKFVRIFRKEKHRILEAFKDCDIYHIGSTAVPGLGGKGIVDILIAINNWKKEKELIGKLKDLGFTHIHKREEGRRFLSKNPSEIKSGDVHIHIVKKNSPQHKQLISFKNYLISNPQEAEQYFKLKLGLRDKTQKEYSKTKGEYIKKLLKKIK